MEQIEAAFRAAGITVPFTHNEKGERSISWSTDYEDVGGAVNVYGLDSYPGGPSCTNPKSGFKVVRNYFQCFSNYSFTSLISFRNSKAAILRPGVEAFTMIVLQSMNRHFQMFITRTILGREQHCKTCIWLGVGRTGVIVSNDLVLWIGPITDTKGCRSCCLYFVRSMIIRHRCVKRGKFRISYIRRNS